MNELKRDNTTTKRNLVDAGIAQGMRVIEIGSGGGEVTEILAELVGSSGRVVAIDSNQKVLAAAQDRLREKAIGHVQFMVADIAGDLSALEALPRESFDALAGRRVLMYLRDAAGALRNLSGWLKKGGVVVFEEADSTMVPASRSVRPAHDQAVKLLGKMLVAEGANTAMGFDLPATFTQAGLRFERIRAEAVIQGQATQYPLSTLLQLMRERLVATGAATGTDVDALAERLDMESRDPTSVYVSDMSFCAWGKSGL